MPNTKIEVKDSNYFYENPNRPIVMTDEEGNEYRIKILQGGGISVNKFSPTFGDQITIIPKVTNEVHII